MPIAELVLGVVLAVLAVNYIVSGLALRNRVITYFQEQQPEERHVVDYETRQAGDNDEHVIPGQGGDVRLPVTTAPVHSRTRMVSYISSPEPRGVFYVGYLVPDSTVPPISWIDLNDAD